MAKKEQKQFTVVNINKRGEVFDPSTVTIHAGEIPGFDEAYRALARKVGVLNG